MKAKIEKLYDVYEDDFDKHPTLEETKEVEREVSKFLETLSDDTRLELDSLIGKLARSYEVQGFVYGLNIGKEGILLI